MSEVLDLIADDMIRFQKLQLTNPEEAARVVDGWVKERREARRRYLKVFREGDSFKVVLVDPNAGPAGLSMGMNVSREKLLEFISGDSYVMEVYGEPPSWA